MNRLLYISHSRQNSGAALKLSDELRKRGIATWLDIRDLKTGEDWKDAIEQAIKVANAFVFVIGPSGPHDYMQTSEWQEVAEGEYYRDPDKPMIPVLIGSPELSGFLNDRQALRIDESDESVSAAGDKIVAAPRDPSSTFDEEKRRVGKESKKEFLEGLREYLPKLSG